MADPVVEFSSTDLEFAEGSFGSIDFGVFSITDVDDNIFKVVLGVSDGSIIANDGDGLQPSGVTIQTDDAQTITILGTVAAISGYLSLPDVLSFDVGVLTAADNGAILTITAYDDTAGIVADTINIDITAPDTPAVVAGDFTGGVNEGNIGDGAVTATGALSISDVDVGDDPAFDDVAATAGDNGYGTFELTAGTWTYTLDQAAVQDLDAGDTVNDTYTFTATDGTTQAITITITGTADAPVVSGAFTGDVTEGDEGDAPVTASGALSISDADGDDSPVFNDVDSTAGDNGYGHFVLSGGTWTYTLDQSTVQDMDAGDTLTDSYTFVATDGTLQDVTVTITGANDAAVVTGTSTGDVTEGNEGDDPVTATGSIAISDVDADDAPVFNDVASTAGDNAYGHFELTGGDWTYTLDQTAVQDLDAGDTVNDTITFTATDGTTQQITVTISGMNDSVVVSGVDTGTVTERNIGDADVQATGTLTIDDLDDLDDPVFLDVAAAKKTYGTYTMTNGTWVYTLDQTKVQNLKAGQEVTDAHTFLASDGTEHTVTVTIVGTDDAPVVKGVFTGELTEGNIGDPTASVSGSLSISDLDGVPAFANVANAAGAYGNFKLAGGTWTYTLDQAKVQNLNTGDTRTDSHTFVATDGTEQTVTVTIKGADEASSGGNTGGTPVVTVPLPSGAGATNIAPSVTGATSGFGAGTGTVLVQATSPVSNFTGDIGGTLNAGHQVVVSLGNGNNNVVLTGDATVPGGLSDALVGGGTLDTITSVLGSGAGGLGGGLGGGGLGGGFGSGTTVVVSGGGSDMIDLSGISGNSVIVGGHGHDTVHGGDGGNIILGGTGADSILGGAGNDHIRGGSGDNLLFGGDGDDRLVGSGTFDAGTGDDYLTQTHGVMFGGTGTDTFRLARIDGDGSGKQSIIGDFDVDDDTLDLRAMGIKTVDDLVNALQASSSETALFKFDNGQELVIAVPEYKGTNNQFDAEEFHGWNILFATDT